MRTCIQFLGLTLALLLLAGCAALQSVVEPPPTPTPAVPALPAPMPEDPYGLDFPPVPVWDFYREWLENPAAAHYKYYGRTVTLAYVRGLVPHPEDGVFLAALQAPKGAWRAEQIQEQIQRGTANRWDAIDPFMAGWGPWLESYHRPLAGRDFQMRCNPALHLAGIVQSFFVLEAGPSSVDDFVGPLSAEGFPVREARALWDEKRPLSKAPPLLRMQAEEWNDRVYVVHGRVLGHAVGNVPYGGDGGHRSGLRPNHSYLHVEMDHCDFELMDITTAELDAWFDANRERLPAPEGRAVPYRPLTIFDHVDPVAEPLTREVEDRLRQHVHTNFSWSRMNIVGRTDNSYVLQKGGYKRFMLAPITDFTKPRSDAPPLPVITESGNVHITSNGWVGPNPLGLDKARRNWLFRDEGPCAYMSQNWPECIPAAKAEWMSDPENRRIWVYNGGD